METVKSIQKTAKFAGFAYFVIFGFVLLESLVLTLIPMDPWVFPGTLAVLFEIVIGLWLMTKA